MLRRYRKIMLLSAFVIIILLVIIVAWVRGEYSYWAALTVVAVIGIVGVSAAEIRYLMQLSREAQDMGDLVDQISAVREGDMEAPLYLPEAVSYTHLDVYKRQGEQHMRFCAARAW